MTKKKKALIDWRYDAGFYSYEIRVKARTKGEARKKALEKLNKTDVKKFINKHTTYLEKED